MKTLKAIEIIFASTVATLMLAPRATAQQHFSRYENRLADRAEALQSAPERAPAVSWYERKTGRGLESQDATTSATIAPVTRFHERVPKSCSATLAMRPQRPWCG